MNVARAIKLTRVARGLSQHELAETIGISASYLSLLESGRKEPSFSMVRRIAEGIGVSDDVLLLTAIDFKRINQKGGDQLSFLLERLASALLESEPRDE